MGGIRGRRKAIVMFSEGIDYPIYDIFGSQAATTVMTATRNAIAAAARGNVSFFAVDPRGLVGMTSEAIELNAAADAALSASTPKGSWPTCISRRTACARSRRKRAAMRP